MGLMDVAKNVSDKVASTGIGDFLTRDGWVTGSAFKGATLHFEKDGDESVIRIGKKDGDEFILTRDKVKNAELLCMGVIEIKKSSNVSLGSSGGGTTTTLLHGAKYKVELTDGRIAIITVGLGNSMEAVENVLF